ncbi:cell division protein SepF [Rothia sp. ZJ932]|uniref:cell division protein SepF n=1 Tax=Rothia sp. ZJ932 TaxID=2810516 RepID=UPI0019680238|nr:cell division protein SepF [Rothia sp. ZJ932]QRZ60932.1 cell division protein SepF [Rothia sp. ZJ932]
MSRTLQQAMAYLGLAEPGEPAPAQRSTNRREEYYRDEDLDFPREEFFEDYNTTTVEPVSPETEYEDTSDFNEVFESTPIAEVSSGSGSKAARSQVASPAATTNESEEELRRITTIHPRSYNDAKIIGESFRENIPVIMNVTDMAEGEAKRLVDFSAGLAFALHGSIERVTDKVFLLTPANLEVLGAEGTEIPVPVDEDSHGFFNQD